MAYAGICGKDDLQPHTDPYFSQKTQTQVSSLILAAPTNLNEIQQVALKSFDGTDSFKLDFGGTQTATIARGTNYTAAGIKAAVQAVTGGTVTVRSMWSASSTVSDTGFELTYSGTADVTNPTVVPVSGTFTALANDLQKGGPTTNNGTPTTTGNHNPAVTAPAARTIPIRTPFTLTGSGTDSDGNPLVYLWEQNNTGTGSSTMISNTRTSGPLFRVFGKYANVTNANTILYNSPGENLATTSPSRTFPDLAQILAGSTNVAAGTCPTYAGSTALPDGPTLECYSEFLPTTARTMNFRLTARDQVATGGGTSSADVAITVSALGPFLVSSPNAAVTFAGGSSQTITWSSTMASLAANVKISLSTDGGQTFPTVISASTPNDGTESLTIPNVASTQARIKIEAVDNYFFDVSDANFTITASGPAPLSVDDTIADTLNTQYSDGITASFSAATGVADSAALVATPTGLPAGLTLAKTASSPGGTVPGTATWAVQGTTTAAPGSFPVTIDVTDGATHKTVDFTVVVAAEDATPTYTGPTSAVAPTGGNDAINLTLTANVSQAADGHLGDLATATATFTDTTTGDTLCTSPVTAGGAASCVYSADLPPGNTGRVLKVKITVGGNYAGTTAADTTLTVSVQSGLVVTPPVDAAPVTQYSDGVSLLFSATSGRPAANLTATPVGLPAGLSLTQTGSGAAASWSVTGTTTDVAGSYPVTVTVSDGTQQQDVLFTITVNRENATPAYTGPTSALAQQGGNNAIDLTLTATVTQANDGTPGDLALATATFTDTTTGDTLCSSAVTAAGAASCLYSADLPPDGGRTYAVRVTVGGRFTGVTPTDTTLVVSVVEGLTVTAPPATVSTQYSDGVTASLSATSDRASANLTATPAGLPAGLALTPSGTAAARTWTVTGTVTGAPATYNASIEVGDGTETATVPLQVVVATEDSLPAYTGPSSATLAHAGDPTVPVTLTAQVSATSDGTSGDITTAKVDFVDVTTASTLCTNVAVTGTAGLGTAACTIAAEAGRSYDLRVVVGGRYSGTSTGPSPLVVHDPPPAPTAPDTALSSAPGRWLLASSATFGFGASLPGSSFVCTLDGVAAPCSSPYTVAGLGRSTHTMTVAASKAGLIDATPVRSVFTVPVDDTSLKARSRAWHRKQAGDAYLGTYSQARKKGVVLTYKVSGVRALALVVGTGKGYGKVKVFLGKKLLGKVSLKGPRAGSQVVEVATFATATSGKVRLVTATGKTVRIEGLGVAAL